MMNEVGNIWEIMETYIPSKVWDDLIYIGRKGDITLYKHIDSRRYINIDSQGKCYSYTTNGYVEVDFDKALNHLLS